MTYVFKSLTSIPQALQNWSSTSSCFWLDYVFNEIIIRSSDRLDISYKKIWNISGEVGGPVQSLCSFKCPDSFKYANEFAYIFLSTL